MSQDWNVFQLGTQIAELRRELGELALAVERIAEAVFLDAPDDDDSDSEPELIGSITIADAGVGDKPPAGVERRRGRARSVLG